MSKLLLLAVHHVGKGALLTLALLLLALGSLTLSLASLVRGSDTWLLLQVMTLALVAGWWLGGRVRRRAALALLPVCGCMVSLLLVGQLGGLAVALLASLGRTSEQQRAGQLLGEAWALSATLLARLSDWALALFGGSPVFDPIAAGLFWSLILWHVSAWAAWSLRAHALPLQALLPAGVVQTALLVYVGASPWPLLALLAALLLLLLLVGQARREQRWTAQGIDFSLGIREDLVLAGLLLLLLLLPSAALAPLISLDNFSTLGRHLLGPSAQVGQQAGEPFGLEPGPATTTAIDRLRAPGLPRRHLIGAGPELSDQLVMAISSAEPAPTSPGVAAVPSQRYYWRSRTYDTYTGSGWYSSQTTQRAYEAAEPLLQNSPPEQRRVQHHIRRLADADGLLYAAGRLVTADVDYSVAWRSPEDMFAAQVDATEYTVESLVPVAPAARLRTAGGAYPEWVLRRYLALPDSVPERVRALARELTLRADSPYDRVRALEAYLRRFPYTLDVPTPPYNRDLTDYFLFDLQRGYCDYYATAMVVLSRAAGLPARLAVGYTSTGDGKAGAGYLISEAEAHSWPEIYFAGYGWVEFEPTAGRPALSRAAGAGPAELREGRSPADPAPLRARDSAWWLALPGALALLALGWTSWTQLDSWRLRRLAPAEAMALIYRRLDQQSRRLALPLQPGATPYELAAVLAEHLAEISPRGWRGTMLRSAAQDARWLAGLYVQAAFSPHGLRAGLQAQAIAAWRRLRWRLRLAQLLSKRSS